VKIAITGIHTGIGKTVATSMLAEALGADYWKPVQAGMEERDSDVLMKLLTNGPARVHPEAVCLTQPMSPHAAAAIDNVEVDYKKFKWPITTKVLLVETAGGILSPMSDDSTMADFIAYFKLPTILITQNYLGSINHTLMSIEVLKNRGIKILGLVINGAAYPSSESFIEQYAGIPVLARIPHFETLTQKTIHAAALEIRQALQQQLGVV